MLDDGVGERQRDQERDEDEERRQPVRLLELRRGPRAGGDQVRRQADRRAPHDHADLAPGLRVGWMEIVGRERHQADREDRQRPPDDELVREVRSEQSWQRGRRAHAALPQPRDCDGGRRRERHPLQPGQPALDGRSGGEHREEEIEQRRQEAEEHRLVGPRERPERGRDRVESVGKAGCRRERREEQRQQPRLRVVETEEQHREADNDEGHGIGIADLTRHVRRHAALGGCRGRAAERAREVERRRVARPPDRERHRVAELAPEPRPGLEVHVGEAPAVNPGEMIPRPQAAPLGGAVRLDAGDELCLLGRQVGALVPELDVRRDAHRRHPQRAVQERRRREEDRQGEADTRPPG